MDGFMIPTIHHDEYSKIIDIWVIYQRIIVSFENIFVSEVFVDYFILFLQKIFMRIVLEKFLWSTHTIKNGTKENIYIDMLYIYIDR